LNSPPPSFFFRPLPPHFNRSHFSIYIYEYIIFPRYQSEYSDVLNGAHTIQKSDLPVLPNIWQIQVIDERDMNYLAGGPFRRRYGQGVAAFTCTR
jgi:hypothetical protein